MARASLAKSAAGFTLLELMIAIGVASLMVAVAVPSAYKMYLSMEYRGAVKEARHLLEAGRYRAMSSGKVADVVIDVEAKTLVLQGGKKVVIPKSMSVSMSGASELQIKNQGRIRFYPDGSCTGGSISLVRQTGAGTKLHVGWLLGEISQQPI